MLGGIQDILQSRHLKIYPLISVYSEMASVLVSLFNMLFEQNQEGLARSFSYWKHFIGNHSVTLILGDNIFFGQGLSAPN